MATRGQDQDQTRRAPVADAAAGPVVHPAERAAREAVREQNAELVRGNTSRGQMRRDLRSDDTPFLRKKAIEATLGNESRQRKLDEFNADPGRPAGTNLVRHGHLPPPAIMSRTQGNSSVKIGEEGDSLVFSRRKRAGDMVHFSTAEGADAIQRGDNVMHPSTLDTRPSAHFGPGVYFTDPLIVQQDGGGGPVDHAAVQRAIYTDVSDRNAQRSARAIETQPEIYDQREVNTYEILPSRVEELRRGGPRRNHMGYHPSVGLLAGYQEGDRTVARRTVHKLETSEAVRLPLRPPEATPAWAQRQDGGDPVD